MSKYITDIQVSQKRPDEQHLQNQGFKKIDVNLNKTGCGENVYIWYKKQEHGRPITKVQVSFNEGMRNGLTNAGYVQVKNPTPGGNSGVYLWYHQGISEYDTKIVKLEVSSSPNDETEKIRLGYERAGCNLTGVSGQWLYLWVKREQQTYICDVKGTVSYGGDEDLLQDGFIRIDETTNTGYCCMCHNTGTNFIWYRQTTDPTAALTDVQVSITDNQRQQDQQQGYTPVDVNLNEGSNDNPVYLWYKKSGPSPIKNIQLLLNPNALNAYEKAGVTVIERNLNVGHDSAPRNLCYFQ